MTLSNQTKKILNKPFLDISMVQKHKPCIIIYLAKPGKLSGFDLTLENN